MKIWLYRDRSGWWEHLRKAATDRGHDARVFIDPTHPDEGTVFARIHHHPDVRNRDKAAMAYMAVNPDLHLVPGYRASVLYDDKAEQARQLAKWMPRTMICYSVGAAERAIGKLGLPLMSKCAEGAGSYNVRFIQTEAEAMAEARAAFGDGIRRHYGQVQTGYLLWQQFCRGNAGDFRVIAVGRERLILRRGNRDDRPMASGSNREMPIEWPDAEASDVLDFANAFFTEERMNFCGVDIVRDHDAGRWVILECTTGWPTSNNDAHRTVSGRPWGQFFDIIVDEIEAGAIA